MLLSTLFTNGTQAGTSETAERFRDYVQDANEFSERRRLQVLFPNPQHEKLGIQVDLVNVGAGNLTFSRRDIVTVGRVPVGISRVYDSNLVQESADFGPGWTWIGEETLVVDRAGKALTYNQESGPSLLY